MKTPRHIGLFSLALVSLLLALPAHAARLALVIGNDAYNQVAALKNARNDARLVAGVLRKAGFEVSEASNLNRTALWSTLDRFKGRINKGDEVVFYFAGHGVQVGANQLLLPTDISADNDSQVQRDGVPLIDVQDALKDARLAMLLIDACRDNPFPKTGTRTIGSTRGLSPPEASTGQIIMMSAGRNQKALDYVPNSAQANGLFAWELSQVLQTPGLEIRNALEDVKNRVDDKARRAGHEQRPSLVNDLRGPFVLLASLTPEPLSGPIATQMEQQAWAAAQRVNTAAAYSAYLTEYPNGSYASPARVARAGLAQVSVAPPAVHTTGSADRTRLPTIAVATFDGDKDDITSEIWGVIATDLERSGRFKVLRSSSVVGANTRIDRDSWRSQGVQNMLCG